MTPIMHLAGAAAGWEGSGRTVSDRGSQRAFLAACVLLFAGSAALTIRWCTSMSAMGAIPMPGGWTMSMAWMRSCGQTWLEAAASFVAMWTAMMVAMMLPSLIPVLSRWRAAVRRARHIQAGGAIVLVGLGYFCVWTAFGMLIFAVGVALAGIEMQWAVLGRAVPIASGVVMLIAGAVQFTEWKAHHLACSREAPKCALALSTHPTTAFRHGLRLGLHCSLCCANLTMVLLVLGVMDLRAMAAVSLAITVERLAPACKRMAREIGALVLGAGVLVLAQAAGLSG